MISRTASAVLFYIENYKKLFDYYIHAKNQKI